MRSPYSQRPGFSRKAQFSLFAGYVVAVIGIVLGLLLALSARLDPVGYMAIQSLAADATRPIAMSGRAVAEWLGTAMDTASAYIEAGSKNRALEARLRAQHSQLLGARALVTENRELKRLLRVVEPGRTIVATGRLISSTPTSSRRYATLSVGAAQGVANGQPVRGADGLIGRTVAIGQWTARVLLISDTSAVTPLQRLGDGTPAIARGRGDGNLDVQSVSAGLNPFHPGDVFVTSGAGGIFPPNLPVAVALSLTREGTIARPVADPTRLDFVVVEPAYMAAAADLPEIPRP